MVLERQEVRRPSPAPPTSETPDPAPSVTPGPESTCEAFVFPEGSVTVITIRVANPSVGNAANHVPWPGRHAG